MKGGTVRRNAKNEEVAPPEEMKSGATESDAENNEVKGKGKNVRETPRKTKSEESAEAQKEEEPKRGENNAKDGKAKRGTENVREIPEEAEETVSAEDKSERTEEVRRVRYVEGSEERM